MRDSTVSSSSDHINSQDRLRKKFCKSDKVNGKILHNEEFDKLYNSISIVRMVKSGRLYWAESDASEDVD
jgi:hypothetical protein